MAILIYETVNAAISGVLIVPLFVMWVIGLCMARRKGDKARTGFRWMHLAIGFTLLSFVFNVVYSAIIVAINALNSDRRASLSLLNSLLYASQRVSPIRLLFEIIAMCLCIIMFVELGNGFTYARKGARTPLQTACRFASMGAAFVLFIIGIAYFGLFQSAYTMLQDQGSRSNYQKNLQDGRMVIGAWYVLMWIVSIALLVQAALVVHKTRQTPMLRSASVLYLVAVILFFIKFFYGLIYAALYILPSRVVTASPQYLSVIDAIFNEVVTFIFLVIVVCLGMRKTANGLWSSGAMVAPYPQQPQVMYTQQMPQQGYYPQVQQGYQYPQGQPQQYYVPQQQHHVPSQYPTVDQPVTERKPEMAANGH